MLGAYEKIYNNGRIRHWKGDAVEGKIKIIVEI